MRYHLSIKSAISNGCCSKQQNTYRSQQPKLNMFSVALLEVWTWKLKLGLTGYDNEDEKIGSLG